MYNRECIIILDLKNIKSNNKRKPKILAKQVSDFDITCIKFADFSIGSYSLVSCGRENIRFWRIHKEYLPGQTVVLDKFARNTHFTVLAFESLGNTVLNEEEINF